MPTALLPLSRQGHALAREFFSLDAFRSVGAVYCSPYRRAYSTAEKLCGHPTTDDRLRERELGDPETLSEGFWSRQYEDHDHKNTGGESLNDTGRRMTAAIYDILSATPENGTAAVVSHAAAICALLLNWCTIEVMDSQKKERRISHNGAVVLNGRIETPSAFILSFENGRLCGIRYMDNEKQCQRPADAYQADTQFIQY